MLDMRWLSIQKKPSVDSWRGLHLTKCLSWASLLAQTVKNLPVMWETRVQSLGWEDPMEEEMAIYSLVFLPGEFHEQRSLVSYNPWDGKELDTTLRLTHTHTERTSNKRKSNKLHYIKQKSCCTAKETELNGYLQNGRKYLPIIYLISIYLISS